MKIGELQEQNRILFWSDIQNGKEFTFTVDNLPEHEIIRNPHSDPKKIINYYNLRVVTEDDAVHATKKGEIVNLHLPERAIGQKIYHALRYAGLLHSVAKVTIRKDSRSRARVVSVVPSLLCLDGWMD